MNTYPVSFNFHYPTYQQLENFIGLSAWVSIALGIWFLISTVVFNLKYRLGLITLIAQILAIGSLPALCACLWMKEKYFAVLIVIIPAFVFYALSFTGLLG